MKKNISKTKILLVLISLVITFFVWQQGFRDSLNRPSVSFDISQKEKEISELALQSIPSELLKFIDENDPVIEINSSLSKVSFNKLSERNKLILMLSSDLNKFEINNDLLRSFKNKNYILLLNYLQKKSENKNYIPNSNEFDLFKGDLFLYHLLSEKFDFDESSVITKSLSKVMFLKIIAIRLIPLITVFFGIILGLKTLWNVISLKKIGDSRIFLIRHGETNWNKEGRFQGQIDIPLNNNGKEQARKTFEYLKDINFKKAFSSSMKRPYETAQIILKESPELEIIKINELVEISHGLWEGKLEKEILEEWPVLLKKWHEKPQEVAMPEGESIEDVSLRSIKAWDKICSDQRNEDLTLIVAHDAVNKTLICNLLGIDFSNIWMIKQGNGGITVIDIFNDPDKENVVSALNITSHLGGILDLTALGAL